MSKSIPLNTEVEIRNGKIKTWNEYGKNMISMAKHIYEAHEYAAKALGFTCGAEMDEYLRRINET